ncbi:hypothetical protein [Flavobacterium alkalisoli]|uniref:hypothetical protein n=1 Tax=Flavobacterium alkalisoli TaxID=2602769 RepID=UPI003A943618
MKNLLLLLLVIVAGCKSAHESDTPVKHDETLSFKTITQKGLTDMPGCKEKFYKGKVVNTYAIYPLNSLKDTLLLNQSDITAITKLLEQNSDIIKRLSENDIFKEMAAKYARTDGYDSTTLHKYAEQYKGTARYNEYIDAYNDFNTIISKLFADYQNLLHVSVYTNLPEYGDCYFYQRGYDGFYIKHVSNPVIESVLYGITNSQIKKYSANPKIGLEVRETGQIITIPIISIGTYLCDIRLIVCKG